MAAHQTLVERVQRSLPDKPVRIVKRRTGPKVSEMLVVIAEPWLAEARNDDQREMVLDMAVVAWNMAVFDKAELWEQLNPELTEMLGEPVMVILDEMIASKLDLFPEETCPILDYEITGGGASLKINVIYEPSPEDVEDLDLDNQGPEAR
ncbi:MAG TPA: hypothetical protein VEC99_11995 [Clostridia bacterium]|nr:hypothetical protein [Clostridia bacterium]